jgi:hypothetical protein
MLADMKNDYSLRERVKNSRLPGNAHDRRVKRRMAKRLKPLQISWLQ